MNFIYFNADKSIKFHSIQKLVATSNAIDKLYIFTDFDTKDYICHIRFKRSDGYIIGDLNCTPVEQIKSPLEDKMISGFELTLTSDILGVSGPLQITVTYKQTVGGTNVSIAQGLVIANVLEAVDLNYSQNALIQSLLDTVVNLNNEVDKLKGTSGSIPARAVSASYLLKTINNQDGSQDNIYLELLANGKVQLRRVTPNTETIKIISTTDHTHSNYALKTTLDSLITEVGSIKSSLSSYATQDYVVTQISKAITSAEGGGSVTPTKYTIKFVNHDGTVLQTDELEYGATPVYNGSTPTKVNTSNYSYTFTGWTPSIAKVTDDATYTATFSSVANKYTATLNYYPNGGYFTDSGSKISDSVVKASITLTGTTSTTITQSELDKYYEDAIGQGGIERSGYTFLGWSTSSSATSVSNSYQFDISGGHDEIALYAVWKEKVQTPSYNVRIEYNPNGGYFTSSGSKISDTTIVSTFTSSTLTFNQQFFIQDLDDKIGQGEVKKDGYTFLGWGTSSSATSISNTITLQDDQVMLYAVWKKDETVVTTTYPDSISANKTSITLKYDEDDTTQEHALVKITPIPSDSTGYTLAARYEQYEAQGEQDFETIIDDISIGAIVYYDMDEKYHKVCVDGAGTRFYETLESLPDVISHINTLITSNTSVEFEITGQTDRGTYPYEIYVVEKPSAYVIINVTVE